MAELTKTKITPEGITPAPAAVSASDTIDMNIAGSYVILELIGGTGADTWTVVDASKSGSGNPAVSDTGSLPSGNTNRRKIRIPREAGDAAGVVTVTHSAPTGVTYNLDIF